jgi:RNA polymerase sigma factor (sigma-70 family)
MHKSLNFLVDEYCESLKKARHMKTVTAERGEEGKQDKSQWSSMEQSVSYALEWMASGYEPRYSEGPYKNTVPTDPQLVLSRYSNEVTRQHCNEEKIEQVLCILDKLSDKEKDCIMLVWGEGFSYREAAKMLKIPTMTVWNSCKRAKEKLGDIVVEQYRVKEINSHDR